VIVREGADAPGGQLRLASRAPGRRDLIGIVDWRVAECARLGVKIVYNILADARAVRQHDPDVVVVATGGVPADFGEFVTDAWDVLSGSARVRDDVLFYDDNGGHAGLDAAAVVLASGARMEYVTPERMLGADLGGSNYPRYAKAFASSDGVRVTLLHTLDSVHPSPDGRLVARLYSEHADRVVERVVDPVITECGTRPNDELYFDLIADSVNLGEVDQSALLALRPQQVRRNDAGTYQLFRIGDAISSRNVHAAILDAYRLCLAI
jgi:hypothetical protein